MTAFIVTSRATNKNIAVAFHHYLCGLGIKIKIEFRRRGDVAGACHGPAHNHQPVYFAAYVRRYAECRRQVCQRAYGDHRQLFFRSPKGIYYKFHGMAVLDGRPCLR
jgi:hypothetical protein